MPILDDADIEVSAYDWVPEPAKGLVKDLRVRWMLEELGLSYRVRFLQAFAPKPGDYLKEQPFGQVPAYRDDEVQLFESGAILIHLAEKHRRFLPADPAGKARAIGWLCAGLSSVEPFVQQFALITGFYKDEEWAKLRRSGAEDMARMRLQQLADWLGDKEYLEDGFSIGDMMMASVLRIGEKLPLFSEFPTLRTYLDRATARPAFQAALSAQMAGFTASPPQPAAA